jgi:hypothetical protein
MSKQRRGGANDSNTSEQKSLTSQTTHALLNGVKPCKFTDVPELGLNYFLYIKVWEFAFEGITTHDSRRTNGKGTF